MKRMMLMGAMLGLATVCGASETGHPKTVPHGGHHGAATAQPNLPKDGRWSLAVTVGILGIFAGAIPAGLLVKPKKEEEAVAHDDHGHGHDAHGH